MIVEIFNSNLGAWVVLESDLTEAEAHRVKMMWEGLIPEELRVVSEAVSTEKI
jgi:hypothetical protein